MNFRSPSFARTIAAEQAAILISQKRPIPYPVVVRAVQLSYVRGIAHALAFVVALVVVVVLAGVLPW